jgi:hypothetical protein
MIFASRTIRTIFVVALASHCALAQTVPPVGNTGSSGQPGRGTITGQVVDENDQPVPNAVVYFNAARAAFAQTVIANRDGEFQLKDLEPADYAIHARMASYTSGRNDPVDGRYSYRIGDRVRLRLIRGGVVTGKVTDAHGNPVVGVHVRARMIRDGANREITRGLHHDRSTDDRGVYRLYGLWEGTYVVFAGGPETSNGLSYQTTFELDVPTYYPSATRATAAELKVRPGEELNDIDIRYRGEQGRIVSGAVTVPSNLHTGYMVTLASAGDAGPSLLTTISQTAGRNFVFNGLEDGEYSVSAQSSDSSGEIAVSSAKPISVRGADVTGIQLTVKLLGSVSGRVVLEETKLAECTNKEHPLTNEAFVSAVQNENEIAKQVPQALREIWSVGAPVRPDREGNFLLRNLIPNEYYFALRFNAREWYVNSIAFVAAAPTPGNSPAAKPSAAIASLKGRPVDVSRVWTNVKGTERLTNLNITLAHGAASFGAYLAPAEGEQVPARLIAYLVPAETEKANDVFRFFTARVHSPGGRFGFDNVAPGRYWILIQPGEESVDSLPKLRSPNETETRKQLRRNAEAAKNEIELKPCQNVVDFKLPLKPATQN